MTGFFVAWTSARGLALSRMVVGFAALLRAIVTYRILSGVLAPGQARVRYVQWLPEPSGGWTTALVVVWALAAVGFAVGWRTRVTGTVLASLMAFTLTLDQQTYSNHLYLLTLVTILLVVANAGAALSVDARRNQEHEVPAWPIALLRFQASVVYGFAALAKVNLVYLSGAVLLVYLPTDGLFTLPEALKTAGLLAPVAILSVVAEAFIALMIWWPRWRHQAFTLAMMLHVGMVLFIDPSGRLEIAIFALVMFSLLLQFLPAGRGGRTVVWDGHCSFCGTWVRWFQRFDWLGIHSFVQSQDLDSMDPEAQLGLDDLRADADRALQLIDGGHRSQAFAAVRAVLEHLPISFLWAPVFRLWPLSALGERAYAAVAARRRCSLHRPP